MDNNAVYEKSPETGRKVASFFSPDEIKALTARSDLAGFWVIGSTWGVIGLTFAMMAWALQLSLLLAAPLLLLGVAILGGRQLALAICTHEATHRTLFATRWLNDNPVDWFCARPIGLNLVQYREHHFVHHACTGTSEDSDISLIEGLPTTRRSLTRKFLRDLFGLTGAKYLLGQVLMNAELMKWTVASDVQYLPRHSLVHHLLKFVRNFAPTFIANVVLFAILAALGQAILYWAWILAWLIPYPLFLRIRALAEHADTERTRDMFRNTRTTRAGWLARTFVAPLHVNYHIEHHVMASVPWFRLPRLHQLLRERNLVSEPPGYLTVLEQVSSA